MKNELCFQKVPCTVAKLQCLGMDGTNRFKVTATLHVDLPRHALRRIREGRYALADLAVYAGIMKEHERKVEQAHREADAAHAVALDCWRAEVDEAELQGRKPPKEPRRKDPKLPDTPPEVEARRSVAFEAGDRVELFVNYHDVDEEGDVVERAVKVWATLRGGTGSMVVAGARVYLELNLQDMALESEELLRWAGWVKESQANLRLSTGQVVLPLPEQEDVSDYMAQVAAAQAELLFDAGGDGSGEVH